MYIKHVLLLLPIHRRTAQRYQEESERYVANQKEAFCRLSGFQFDGLDRATKISWEDEWTWPAWLFNGIVGFLEIGSDGWNDLGCDVYIKRKYFPKGSRVRGGRQTASHNNEYLRYAETPHYTIAHGDRATYLKALRNILTAALGIVRRRIRGARIWSPPYSWSCLDLSEADRQARCSSITERKTEARGVGGPPHPPSRVQSGA